MTRSKWKNWEDSAQLPRFHSPQLSNDRSDDFHSVWSIAAMKCTHQRQIPGQKVAWIPSRHDAVANVPAGITIHTSPRRVWKESFLGIQNWLSGCYTAGKLPSQCFFLFLFSQSKFFVHHTPMHQITVILFEATYVGYRCLAITCYLYFCCCFQTDQDLLRALW